MKKITTIIATILFSLLSMNLANAGSFGVGVAGHVAGISADGNETETANTGTENSVQSATAGNTVMFGSVFAEYSFGDSERFTLGVDYIPGNADVNSKNISRTDTTADANEAQQQDGTRTANAEISDHITYYAELAIVNGVYAKYGFSQVDIKTKDTETHVGTSGLYPDKTLDAHTFGLGYKGTFGTNGYYKVEGYYTDYDQFKATSTTDKTVTANLDVVGAALRLGYKF